MRKWIIWASASLTALAIVLVPIPYTIFSPRAPFSIELLVSIQGADRPLSGELLAASAGHRKATPALALWALIDPSRDIVRIAPAAEERRLTPSKEAFDEAIVVAASVGLRLAGQSNVEVTSEGLLVTGVAANRRAADVLQPGDILLSANGEPLVVPSDLLSLAASATSDGAISMNRRRDGKDEIVAVPVDVSDEVERRRIEATTVAIKLTLTLPLGLGVDPALLDADGGSAGLLLALAVYDRFAAAPLLDGRRVMGTGSIDRDGNVHPIAGITQKVQAAERADADLFLIPAVQFDEAVAASSGQLRIIPVAFVDDAIKALQVSN